MEDLVFQSPTSPHFFQPLLPGFHSHLSIPVAFFSKHLQGINKHKSVKIRSDASDTTWEVELENGRRLTQGWKEFATTHDFRIGDVIVFRHDGDLVFHVTTLGPSCCEIQYTPSYNIESKPTKKRTKENPRTEEDSSSSNNSCFVANVSASNLYDDKLYVPIGFVRSNGLSITYGEIILLNEKGNSWKLSLDHDKTGVKTFIRDGWRSFCNANGMKRGRYTFKLVQNSGTPIIRLCQAEHRSASESSSFSSWFVGSVTPSSLRKDSQYLPRRFVSLNGLKKGCSQMILKNEYGGTWNLVIRYSKPNDTTVMARGWRSFCEANGLKNGDPFRFKLVRTGGKPTLCLCLKENNRQASLVECSESESYEEEVREAEESGEKKSIEENLKNVNDDIIVKEENIEEEISSRECLNVKRKVCSGLGASSSSSESRFVTLTVTPYSVRGNKLRLPLSFLRANGIVKPGEITLLGQDGLRYTVNLVRDSKCGRMRLGDGWKGFCEAHGVKIGESFVLELISDKDTSLVLKFCTKLKHDQDF